MGIGPNATPSAGDLCLVQGITGLQLVLGVAGTKFQVAPVTADNLNSPTTVSAGQILASWQQFNNVLPIDGTGNVHLPGALIGDGFSGLPVSTSNLNASVSGVVPATGSNDLRGLFTITQTASIAASNRVCTVAFNSSTRYASAPLILLCNQSQGLSSSTTYGGVFGAAAVTTSGFDLMINSTATFAGAGTILVAYFVFGIK